MNLRSPSLTVGSLGYSQQKSTEFVAQRTSFFETFLAYLFSTASEYFGGGISGEKTSLYRNISKTMVRRNELLVNSLRMLSSGSGGKVYIMQQGQSTDLNVFRNRQCFYYHGFKLNFRRGIVPMY